MNSNISKYNNLNFRLKDGTLGFIKVAPSGSVYLYYDKEACKKDWDVDAMMPKDLFMTNFFNEDSFNSFIEKEGLEIVPRDSGIYSDWKVGDRVQLKDNDYVGVIAAKLGDIVFVLNDDTLPVVISTGHLVRHYKLVLTDYEQELLNATSKKEYPFRKGDRVLVRDNDKDAWRFNILESYEKSKDYPYYCKTIAYKQCIPFNEKTWKLLGTTDEYDPDDTNDESH